MKEGARSWLGKLEAEIARELGQPVALAAQGDAPEASRSLVDRIEVPGARLTLAVDSEDAAAFLAEARVIEAGQADAEMVRELWSGIVASVAARLGGKAAPIAAEALEATAEPCALRLGNAVLRMALDVEAAENEAEAPAPARDAGGSAARATGGQFRFAARSGARRLGPFRIARAGAEGSAGTGARRRRGAGPERSRSGGSDCRRQDRRAR